MKFPIAPVLSLISGIIKTISSVVKDKKVGKAMESLGTVSDTLTTLKQYKVYDSIPLSSKRLLNVGVTVPIIMIATKDILSNGVNKGNLCLLAIVMAYSVIMAAITAYSDR